MSCSDHVDIVCSISNSQSCLLWVTSTHHANDLSFLLGTDATSKDDISALTQVNELFDQIIILLDRRQGFSSNNNCVISCLLGKTLISESLDNLNPDALWLQLLKNEHIHCIVEQLARVSNVDCCLHLITRQHPELDSGLLDVIDCFANLILKFILNSCRSNQIELNLQTLGYFVDGSFFIL